MVKRDLVVMLLILSIMAGMMGNVYAESADDAVPGCFNLAPQYTDPVYATAFTGTMAVVTMFGQGNDPVVALLDLSQQSNAPVGQNWMTTSYHPAGWDGYTMGSVFGLTTDSFGSIFVAASSAYNIDNFPNGGGAIYRIDGLSGNVSVFATLPNSAENPALGNITYHGDYQRFYVTNLEDGLIYLLDVAGGVVGTYDHGVDGRVAAGLSAMADDATDGFTQLGRRIWAVEQYENRLYYGVWWQNTGDVQAVENNQVWSVALNAAGSPVASTARLELIVPNNSQGYTNPISDLSFKNGQMLVSERGVKTLTTPVAHSGRMLEYVWSADTSSWTPSTNLFIVGEVPNSAAGGSDYDYHTGEVRVWASGDALDFGTPDFIYGFQGFAPTGGNTTNSILIDAGNPGKTEVGDIELICPGSPRPLAIELNQVEMATNRFSVGVALCAMVLLCGVFTWRISYRRNG